MPSATELPVNRFKRALSNRERCIGLWVALGNSVCAELCAAAGFDWLLIDAEHGTNDVLTVLAQLQAVAPYACHAVVRVPGVDAVTIKRYLDIGAQTLLVPMIESEAQAEALVAATRYAPAGIRGIATMTRAARWGRADDYLRRARAEICLIPQVETAKGIEAIDVIAALDGIDAVFIGPADLAATMGLIGQAGHPDVLAAVAHGLERIHAAGKPAGIFLTSESMAHNCIDQGFDFVAVGSDALCLSLAVDGLRRRFAGR